MGVPADWERQQLEHERAHDKARQAAKERAIAARIWLERAMRSLDTSHPVEDDR